MTKNCSRCGQIMKEVPAGVSKKTGKPYRAFLACDACKNTENIGGSAPVQIGKDAKMEVLLAMQKDIKEILRIVRQETPEPPNPFEGGAPMSF